MLIRSVFTRADDAQTVINRRLFIGNQSPVYDCQSSRNSPIVIVTHLSPSSAVSNITDFQYIYIIVSLFEKYINCLVEGNAKFDRVIVTYVRANQTYFHSRVDNAIFNINRCPLTSKIKPRSLNQPCPLLLVTELTNLSVLYLRYHATATRLMRIYIYIHTHFDTNIYEFSTRCLF